MIKLPSLTNIGRFMATHFARFNIKLNPLPDLEENLIEWEELLVDAAVNGGADEYEFFYIAEKRVIGISIPYESDDPVTLLEAASALGYCHAIYENSDMDPGEISWLSMNDSDDSIIYTSYGA
jgi:hypothetical protein